MDADTDPLGFVEGLATWLATGECLVRSVLLLHDDPFVALALRSSRELTRIRLSWEFWVAFVGEARADELLGAAVEEELLDACVLALWGRIR